MPHHNAKNIILYLISQHALEGLYDREDRNAKKNSSTCESTHIRHIIAELLINRSCHDMGKSFFAERSEGSAHEDQRFEVGQRQRPQQIRGLEQGHILH